MFSNVYDAKAVHVKGAQSRLNSLKSLAKLFNCNPRQSSPSLAIPVPLLFIIISDVFLSLKSIICRFRSIYCNGNFVDAQNNSKIP